MKCIKILVAIVMAIMSTVVFGQQTDTTNVPPFDSVLVTIDTTSISDSGAI